MNAVRVDGGLSDWFATVVGVLQGCILSRLLFPIFLEVVMALVLDGNEIGADIVQVIVFPTSAFQMTLALWLEGPAIYNS